MRSENAAASFSYVVENNSVDLQKTAYLTLSI